MAAELCRSARPCAMPARSIAAIERGDRWLLARQHEDGALGVRARGRRDDPGRIHAAGAFPRPHRQPSSKQRIAVLSARDPGRARRLAAVPRRRVRPQRVGQGVFRAEGGRRPGRRAAHGAGARGDPGARRRRAHQCLHPHSCWRCSAGAVARGAGDAGRDHAAAALVSVSYRQGVVLVAHGDRAAAGADGEAAAGAATRAASRSPNCSSRRRRGARLDHAGRPGRRSAGRSSRLDRLLRWLEPTFPQSCAAARDRQGGRLRHRAAERRAMGSAASSRRWPTA